jgi:hypothetical protein
MSEFLVFRVGSMFLVSWRAVRSMLGESVHVVDLRWYGESNGIRTTTLSRATNAVLFRELDAFQ